MSNKTVLLLSAKSVPVELQVEFGPIPSGMIPINGRPAIHYIAQEYLKGDPTDIVVAGYEHIDSMRSYLDRHPELGARLVNVGATTSLGESVRQALMMEGTVLGTLVIHFADTYLPNPIVEVDTVFYSRREDLYRWTTFELDHEKRIINVTDKERVKPTTGKLPVLIGVFQIMQATKFLALLADACSSARLDTIDPLYLAIQQYFNALEADSKCFREIDKWYDLGHLDTYYEAKRTLFSGVRYFNSVTIDNRRGVIRKSSHNLTKFRQEIEWYLNLPPSLEDIIPRIFKYDLEAQYPFVEMEFYGYPTLSDAYLYAKWDLGTWAQVLNAISYLLDRMTAEVPDNINIAAMHSAINDMYLRKTVERVESVLKDSQFSRFNCDTVLVNGTYILGIKQVLQILPDAIEQLGINISPYFSVIHGDLCLSNILYDRRNTITRVVDPRGCFGTFQVHGDPRYDLAKLAHSLEGDYDFIVNDLFNLRWDQEELWFDTHVEETHKQVKTLFQHWIAQRCSKQGLDLRQIQFIESLLFLSMLPLHADYPLRQEAFMVRGLQLFTQTLLSSDFFLDFPTTPTVSNAVNVL